MEVNGFFAPVASISHQESQSWLLNNNTVVFFVVLQDVTKLRLQGLQIKGFQQNGVLTTKPNTLRITVTVIAPRFEDEISFWDGQFSEAYVSFRQGKLEANDLNDC